MIKDGIIELVEEYEWVSPMVVQEKKAEGEIIICVDLRKLNDACVRVGLVALHQRSKLFAFH